MDIKASSTVVYLKSVSLLYLTNDFRSWLISEDLARESIRNLTFQFREFGQFCDDHQITANKVDVNVARSYLEWLKNRLNYHTGEPLSANYRAKHYQMLKRIGKFLKEKGLIESSELVSNIRKPTRKESVIQSFSAPQLQAIINAARDLRTTPRYKDRISLLLFLLASTGLRINEALNIKLSEVDLDRRIVTVLGKGNKERVVPFSEELSCLILEFVSLYKIERSEYLFASRYGKPLNATSVRDVLRKTKKSLGSHLGIDRMRVSPHTFRHTFARMWVVKGGNTIALSRILGHASTQMTDHYVRLWGVDLNQAYDLCDPCAAITITLSN